MTPWSRFISGAMRALLLLDKEGVLVTVAFSDAEMWCGSA